MCIISISLGFLTSLFYIIVIDEVKLTRESYEYDMQYKKVMFGQNIEEEKDEEPEENEITERKSSSFNKRQNKLQIGKSVCQWLMEATFYIHAIVYTCARLAINTTMTLQPFYLTVVLGFVGEDETKTPIEIALVPLCSYISSFIFSLLLQQRMTRCLRNRYYPMMLSILIVALSSVPLYFLK